MCTHRHDAGFEEVVDVAALGIGVEQRQADGAPGDVGHHGGHLAQQQDRGELALVGVVRVEGVLVVGGQAGDARLEDGHGVARGGEGGEEGAEILVQEAVAGDAPLEALEGGGVGQLAVDEQVGDLQKGERLMELALAEQKENLKELQGDYSQITWSSQIRSYVASCPLKNTR